MGMLSKRSGADYGKIGLSEKNSANNARTDKNNFSRKGARRKEKHKHNNLFSVSLRGLFLLFLTGGKGLETLYQLSISTADKRPEAAIRCK
jgi:hypothetical protein